MLDRLYAMKRRKQSQRNQDDIETIIEAITPFLKSVIKRHEDRNRGISSDLDGLNPVHEAVKFLSSISKIQGGYGQFETDLSFLDGEYNDINHAVEFLGDEDELKLMEFAKMMQRNRKDRRHVKNILEASKPLRDLLQKYSDLQKEAQKVLNETRKIVESQNNRTYTPRELTTLAGAFKEANERKKANAS